MFYNFHYLKKSFSILMIVDVFNFYLNILNYTSYFQGLILSIIYWFIGLLVYWFIGLLVYWFIGLLVYWFIGLLVYWFIGLLVYWLYNVFLYYIFLDLEL